MHIRISSEYAAAMLFLFSLSYLLSLLSWKPR
jgi:hypothetical protein